MEFKLQCKGKRKYITTMKKKHVEIEWKMSGKQKPQLGAL